MIRFDTTATFQAEFTANNAFASTVFTDPRVFATVFSDIVRVPATEFYKGPYSITPRMDAQVLPTTDLLMAHDLTVETIPVTYTSNTYGGKTVVIG